MVQEPGLSDRSHSWFHLSVLFITVSECSETAVEGEVGVGEAMAGGGGGGEAVVGRAVRAGGRLRRAALLEEGEELEGEGGVWRVGAPLAEGGFGQIFLAEPPGPPGPPAAIKAELWREEDGEAAALLRVERQVYASLSRLGEPEEPQRRRFLRLLGWGRLPGRVQWLALELGGRNLAELKRTLGQDFRFSERSALGLGLGMVEALEQLHSTGWLHRDVKPSNFCLGRDGAGLFLLDFGLARRWRDAEGRHRVGRVQCGFRGTLRYASIHVHLGQDMSRRDDLASLAYLLAEQRLGRLPWRRLQDKPLVLDHKAEWAQSVDQWGPATSPPIVFLYRHCRGLAFADPPDFPALKDAFRDRLRLLPHQPPEWHPAPLPLPPARPHPHPILPN